MLDPLKDELSRILAEISTEFADRRIEVRGALARTRRRSAALLTRSMADRVPAPPNTRFGDERDRPLVDLKRLLSELPWSDEPVTERAVEASLRGLLSLRGGDLEGALAQYRDAGLIVPADRPAPETIGWLVEHEIDGRFAPGTALRYAHWPAEPDRWGAVVACAGDGPEQAVGTAEYSRYEPNAGARLAYLDGMLRRPLDRVTEAIVRLDRALLLAAGGGLAEATATISPDRVDRLAPYGSWAWPLVRAWIGRAASR